MAVYPGRRQPILVKVLALDGVVTIVVAGWMIWEAAAKRFPPIFFGVAPLLVLGFLSAAWMLLHSNYEIDGTDLVVREGPSRRTIPIASIEEILPVPTGPLAGRLQVGFAPGTTQPALLLSPVDREALLQGLAQADSGLTYDGERVTRQAPV
jgi:hypothetical protein